MAKQRRTSGRGTLYKRKGSPNWWMAWYRHDGKRLDRSTGTRDRAAAEHILAKKVMDALLRKEGVIDARLDSFTSAECRPIEEHVCDFVRSLRSRAVTAKHLRTTELHVRRAVSIAKVERLSGLTISAAQMALEAIRSGEATGKAASLRTCGAHHRSIKTFTRWLARDGRIVVDPLLYLPGYSSDTDRRLERRALEDEELDRLIEAAECGDDVLGLSGVDRAIAYQLAVGTGFRASEIRSLTPERFDLEAGVPTVTVRAGHSKRRRDDEQPIRSDLADRLRDWLEGKTAGEPVLDLPHRAAEMFRRDLGAARTTWLAEARTRAEHERRAKTDFLLPRDHAGRTIDFHSLRHTFITRVVASGASVKVAQELARHSTPLLTIGRYAHTRLHDLTHALDSLPAMSVGPTGRVETALRPTGTD